MSRHEKNKDEWKNNRNMLEKSLIELDKEYIEINHKPSERKLNPTCNLYNS